jgi:hypothetical protein
MQKIVHLQSSMSLDQRATSKFITENTKVKVANKMTENTSKEFIELVLDFIITSSIDHSVRRANLAEVCKYAINLFEDSIENSINVRNLCYGSPRENFYCDFDNTMISEYEPLALDFENWNRGCVESILKPPKIKKVTPQISAQDNEQLLSLTVNEVPRRRLSARKSEQVNMLIVPESPLKRYPSGREETISVTNADSRSLVRQPTNTPSGIRLIKISQMRSLSINTQKIEESLRNLKILELGYSETDDGTFRKSHRGNSKRFIISKDNQKEVRNSVMNKHIEKTFGIKGEPQEIKILKTDKISSLIQYAK